MTTAISALLCFLQFGDLPASGGPVTKPDDLSSQFEVPAGAKVELWAEPRFVCNPTAIDVDRHNRVWVAEAANYRQWRGRNPGFSRPGGDRIVILSDEDGDQEADRLKVFVQDPDLVAPLGILNLGTRIIVSCSPHVLVYWDTNLDDVPDRREIFLTGFGGHDHDHGVHSLAPGPDGALYLAVGNAGPHLVKDRSGFDLRSGSIYRDGGAEPADNKPGLVSSDGRIWTGGLVLRVEANGTSMSVVAHNFRNQYEVALDAFGDVYTSDNDDDGNQACRTTWVMRGANYGFFANDGSRVWQADRRPDQGVLAAHWHADDPGVAPPGTINGAGGPTGVALYESDVLGFALQGSVLNADAGASKVYAHKPVARGAGIELEKTVLLAPKPDAKDASWFRPSDVCVSPDGTIYVADWWDPGVGGHGMADREGKGRILRISPRGQWIFPAQIDLNSVSGRAAALDSPSPPVRWQALAAYRARRLAAGDELAKIARSPNPRLRARALFALAETERHSLVVEALREDVDERVRIAALRALHATKRLSTELCNELALDRSAGVRRELALTLRDEPYLRSGTALEALARGYDGVDRAYLEALGIGAERKEEVFFERLLAAQPDRSPAAWSSSFARIAWRLHPPSAVPAFVERARAVALPLEERKLACDALAFVFTREAAEAMLDLALRGPQDLRATAAWWTQHRGLYEWRAYGLGAQVGGGDLDDASLAWSSGIVKRGRVEYDVPLRGSERVWLVATEGAGGQSCDWADWVAPRLVGANGALELWKTKWIHATSSWGDVHRGKNCTGGALSIDGRTFEDGIGTHAHSVIAFDVPAGYERLQGGAGIDDGGAGQGDRADVEFQVWIEPEVDREAQRALVAPLLDANADDEAIARSAEALAKDREGAWTLLALAHAGKLSEKARAAVGARIFANADPAVRALASQSFARPVDGGAALPPIQELAREKGSPVRGQALFFGAKSTCSTCHAFHGRGGDVGPDLTRIATKYDAAGILDAVLNPSRAIELGYETWLFETHDEVVHSGFVLADGETVVLKDTSGKRIALDASEIASRKKLAVSSMPDNVGTGLSADELVDLVAFLQSDPLKPGKRLEPIQLFDGQSFAGWTHHLSDSTKSRDDVWSIQDGVLRCSGDPAGYLRTEREFESFVLELEWRFDPAKGAGNSGVLMRQHGVDKVWPKSIEAQLMSRNAGDLWNIDEFAMQADPTRTIGRRTEKALPCNEGPLGAWNRYRITLDGGELTVEVNGEVQNRASWCEVRPGHVCLQSEGAYIEFRNIVLSPIER